MTRIKWAFGSGVVFIIGLLLIDGHLFSLNAKNMDVRQFSGVYPTLGQVRDVIIAKGTVAYDYQFKLRSHVNGQVTKLDLKEGDGIIQGQVLLRIVEPQLEMDLHAYREELRHEQEKITALDKDFYAVQRLVEVGGMSRYELDQKRLELHSAKQEKQRIQLDIDRLEQKKQLSNLISPVQGLVMSVSVENSLRVNAGDELLSVSGGDGPYIITYIDAIDAERIQIGQVVFFSEKEDSGQHRQGRVTQVSPLIADSHRPNSVKVTIEPDQAIDDLRLSQQLYVEVVLVEEDDVLRIPQELIYQQQGQQVVYVMADSGEVNRRTIVTAPGDVSFAKVISGVSLTDRLISKPEAGQSP